MIFFSIIVVIVVLVLEYTLSRSFVDNMEYRASIDKVLYEPGEQIVLKSEIRNYNRSIVPFVRLREYIPAESLFEEEDKSVYHGMNWVLVEKTVPMKGREKLTKRELFTLSKRGRYDFGDYQLGAGDIFGWHESTIAGSSPHSIVIMPQRAANCDLIKVVEGFIGDISVQRYIMEDPILTIGFNDYTGREPMKDISWIRTAVANKLQVKKYDHTTDINVTVMLNFDGEGDEDMEECFRITRMVIEQFEEAHIPYGFRTNGFLFGPTGYFEAVPKGLGETHIKEIMFGLATAKLDRVFSFSTLVDKVSGKRKQNENYFIITRELDEAGRQALNRLQKHCTGKIGMIVGREERQ
ncbi:MAG: DUF58 domain-containing protein [Lachnospiraceae bacterium]|nr:DUF58 domain-containing protein [Lachnospiraceae bacterium]